MSLKPWRELVFPHRDVLEETFRQSAFHVDITQVHSGKATHEYQDAAAFFERTVITTGMRWLLTQVAQRLIGQSGESVIWIQTARGSGKTHTLLAAYHLVSHRCALTDLIGVPELLNQAAVVDVPRVHLAVLDGAAHTPSHHWKRGQRIIRTLWGELAWQLGGEDGFHRFLNADATGTSPGKELLRELLENYAPCIVLIDELITYIRQFPEGRILSGGSYESNLSFVHALIEAASMVPMAIVLASLPQNETEVGHPHGITALRTLKKNFATELTGWTAVTTDEMVDIVRYRLFAPVRDLVAQHTVCRAFTQIYEDEAIKFPIETQESRYLERLTHAYPIHPEIFDRFYIDWTTMDGFSGTSGILKFMAKVVSRLWRENNRELMILPGSLPLYDGGIRNDLIDVCPHGWRLVIEHDIDGELAGTTELENHESRFGLVNAAHRVARTIFLGSAPFVAANIRGLDRARILLGCLQPGQASSIYFEALARLSERLLYLHHVSDKNETTHFWFDPHADAHRDQLKQNLLVPITPSDIAFHGSTEIPATLFAQFADQIVAALAAYPQAMIKVTVEISPEIN